MSKLFVLFIAIISFSVGAQAQDGALASLAEMGFQQATAEDRAEAEMAGVTFQTISSADDARHIVEQLSDLNNLPTTSVHIPSRSSNNAVSGSASTAYTCTHWFTLLGLSGGVDVDIIGNGGNRRFGTVRHKWLTFIGLHPFTWLSNVRQYTEKKNSGRKLVLKNHFYIKQGATVGSNDLVITHGPYSWNCNFNV